MKNIKIEDTNGIKLNSYIYKPTIIPIAIIQIIHGASEHSFRYDHFANYLCENGYVVIMHDHLGHGLTTSEHSYVHFDNKFGDKYVIDGCMKVYQYINDIYPHLETYLIGHSMGSFIARKLLMVYPDNYKKAVISGTTYASSSVTLPAILLSNIIGFLYGKKHISKLLIGMSSDKPINLMKEKHIIKDYYDWLTRDKDIVNKFLEDKLCGAPFTTRAIHDLLLWLNFVCKKKNIKKGNKKIPIFFVSGKDDGLSEFGVLINKCIVLYRKCGYINITKKIYPDFRHEVLNELGKQTIYKDIINFLK